MYKMNELEPELSNLRDMFSKSKKLELPVEDLFVIIECFYRAKEAGLTHGETSVILEDYGFASNISYTVPSFFGKPEPHIFPNDLIDSVVSKMLKSQEK